MPNTKPASLANKGGKKQKLPIEREGIIPKNPEEFYTFGDEIGTGKFAVVKHAIKKADKSKWAAKIIKYDADSVKFAIREYDLMVGGRMTHKGLVKLHEAYLVRKYLILIMDIVDGRTLLDWCVNRKTLNEDDVAGLIKQLVEILLDMHQNNCVHLDLRPTNIRIAGAKEVKLVDYNSSRYIANKKVGEVVDVIGDTEFCAPEMLKFEPVSGGSDMWSVGVLTYILLSGISPFYYEDEQQVLASVEKVKWSFDANAFAQVTCEAKEFIKACLKRAPEQRLSAADALDPEKTKWLSDAYSKQRKAVALDCLDTMRETDERLLEEEEEDYVYASLVLRTFDEDEYESPDDDDDEEE